MIPAENVEMNARRVGIPVLSLTAMLSRTRARRQEHNS
jgi:hypothetical protein